MGSSTHRFLGCKRSKRVQCGEPNVFSKFSPPRSLAPPRGAQPAKGQALRVFRFSLFHRPFPLACQTRASSTSPQALPHGLCPDSLHLVNGRARSTHPTSDIFHTARATMVNEPGRRRVEHQARPVPTIAPAKSTPCPGHPSRDTLPEFRSRDLNEALHQHGRDVRHILRA